MQKEQAAKAALPPGLQFFRMRRVCQICGLSKTEVYRRIESGRFPRPHKYPDSTMNFWLSTEIEAWQAQILAEVLDPEDFLTLLGG